MLNIAEKANEVFEDMAEARTVSSSGSDSDSISSSDSDNETSRHWWEDEKKRLERDPVLSLALCCKSFHRQAICVIWKTLYSLFPLFECFPDDVWDPADSADARASSDYSRNVCAYMRPSTLILTSNSINRVSCGILPNLSGNASSCTPPSFGPLRLIAMTSITAQETSVISATTGLHSNYFLVFVN